MNNWIKFIMRVILRLFPRVAYPVIRGPLQGTRFILGALAGEGGGASVYLNMIEPDQTSAFVDAVKSGEVFFDIGANVGYYTILGAKLVGPNGKVFAFEPVIRNIAYLYKHVTLNKMNNITIMPSACSDTLSLQVFSAGRNFAEGHLGEDSFTHDTSPVLSVSVDDVVQSLDVYPDVIKIDVEGAELVVLKGANATLHKAKPKIFLSTHSKFLKSTCLEYLKECGYSYEVLSHDKINPSEFLAVYVGN